MIVRKQYVNIMRMNYMHYIYSSHCCWLQEERKKRFQIFLIFCRMRKQMSLTYHLSTKVIAYLLKKKLIPDVSVIYFS